MFCVIVLGLQKFTSASDSCLNTTTPQKNVETIPQIPPISSKDLSFDAHYLIYSRGW